MFRNARSQRRLLAIVVSFGGCLILGPMVRGQGVLVVVDPNVTVRLPRPIIMRPMPMPRPVPAPAMSYKIRDLSVHGSISDQVARVEVAQTFANTGSVPIEAAFVFPLPYDGAVERLTFMVDGKEIDGKLIDAQSARRIYEEIVRKNRDPALLEWMGMGMFKTSVFPIPAGAERCVSLKYTQLCRKSGGLTEFLMPLSTAKYTSEPVGKVSVELAIESGEAIKNVYSPTHSIEIKRPDERHARVSWIASNQVPANDFRLFFDSDKGAVGARVISYRPTQGEDGYFLLLASPTVKAADAKRPNKTVVLVVDRSGSMSGAKIEQAKNALKFVLNNLRDGDLFNVIAYDTEVSSFKPELQRFNEQTRAAALGFAEGLFAGGSTNIDGALKTALSQLQDSNRPNYVIFLTDGLPTTGETNEMKIVENAKGANKVRARMFDFGVGYDVNSRLLDKLARANFGQSEYVRPDEDIEAHISRLYNKVGAPAMTEVQIAYGFDTPRAEDGEPVNRVYPKEVFDLFEGDQLVVVGRYRKSGAAKVTISGKVGDEKQSFSFPAEFASGSHDETFGFVEKLWAVRRIGEIIDELDLKGQNPELVKELVELSTKHGVLTPYTSFLANEETRIHDVVANSAVAAEGVLMLKDAGGRGGFAQRDAKASYQRAAAPMSAAPGRASYRDADDKEVTVASVQNVGNKTFYCREKQWIESTVTPEQQKNAIKLVQFSDAYFELANKHGRTISQYMAFDDPVYVNVEGKTYCIEPAATTSGK